jgi:transcriptional regulator
VRPSNDAYRLSEEKKRDDRIIALYRKGYLIREIARRAHCATITIQRVVYSHGLTRPRTQTRKVDKRRDRSIISMRRRGYTLQEIGRAIGCSASVVHRVVIESGQFPSSTRKMTAAEVKRILTMRESGKSFLEIADVVNRTTSVIHYVISEGRPLWKSLKKSASMTKKRRDRILGLRRKGKTLSEIASVMRLPKTNVHRILAKMGLPNTRDESSERGNRRES